MNKAELNGPTSMNEKVHFYGTGNKVRRAKSLISNAMDEHSHLGTLIAPSSI